MHPDQSGISRGGLRIRDECPGHRRGPQLLHRLSDRDNHRIGRRRPRSRSDLCHEGTAATGRCSRQRYSKQSSVGSVEAGTTPTTSWVTSGRSFTEAEMEGRLRILEDHVATRKQAKRTVGLMRRIAERSYSIRFEDGTPLSEQVLMPAMSAESKGMEDARFVRFVEDDGERDLLRLLHGLQRHRHRPTIARNTRLLGTSPPRRWSVRPRPTRASLSSLAGSAAVSPRSLEVIGSRTRSPTRTIRAGGKKYSHASRRRHRGKSFNSAIAGHPIETEAGWLVLTHGVGPMRTYSIGAMLLDLEDPTRILGQLPEPLLSPAPDEQDGYVPNVVYSCGALLHGRTLVLPYGIGDSAIGCGDGASRRTSRSPSIRPRLTPGSRNDWRTPCLIDPRRSRRERNPANP